MIPAIIQSLSPDCAFKALVLFIFEDDWSGDSCFVGLPPGDIQLLRSFALDQRFTGKRQQFLSSPVSSVVGVERVVLLGCGKRDTFSTQDLRRITGDGVRQSLRLGLRSVVFSLKSQIFPLGSVDSSFCARHIFESACLATYKFNRYKTIRDPEEGTLELVGFLVAEGVELNLAPSSNLVDSIERCRDWVNEPAGQLTPLKFASAASAFLEGGQVSVEVLTGDAIAREKMGMLMAVGMGSDEAPCVIHCAYRPSGATKKIVLVGKGITFDSGGYSLKPSDSMKDMKGDMAGAAAVIASMKVIAELNIPIEVHAIAPCAENMVSGRAYRLGDVLVSRAGKTVEITNTDAEGRLVLGDALDYAVGLKPDLIIDLATLTGACVVALGPSIAGVMGTDASLIESWIASSARAGETMWPLPLPTTLKEQLKSDVADMRNAGDRWGGALIAGLFLKEFVGEVPWLHVDIAGPAFSDKERGDIPKGGTGFGVATIVEFLSSFKSSS